MRESAADTPGAKAIAGRCTGELPAAGGVYVDTAIWQWQGLKWAHLLADDADELHCFAARLGIHPTARDYNKVATANGVTRAALVELRMVEVGNIVVRNVPALIHSDEALGVNLLGMSFLSRVRWTHERGRLLLEQ